MFENKPKFRVWSWQFAEDLAVCRIIRGRETIIDLIDTSETVALQRMGVLLLDLCDARYELLKQIRGEG